MAGEHTVKDGEYLSSIAKDYGFAGYKGIWNHPRNAALKEQRKNPNVLMPGDVLFIPDRESKQEPAVTEKRHRYQVDYSPLQLRIILKDESGEPIANAAVQLTVEGSASETNTDSAGLVEQEIRPTSHEGNLLLRADGLPTEVEIPLRIGFLHPVEDLSGIQARLNNLGYNAGEAAEEDGAMLRSAIEEFQCDHSLTPDGKISAVLQAKLKEIHGC